MKELLTSPPILTHYSPKRKTSIAADASGIGIGAVLLQIQEDGSRRPVSFISRSLNDAEKNYATIAKEALAATWASESFNEYLLGLEYTLETDHKPLLPLLSTKEIAKMPPRIPRFRLRLMRYSPTVIHVAGKEQITADALSRAPASTPKKTDINFLEHIAAHAKQSIEIFASIISKIGRH